MQEIRISQQKLLWSNNKGSHKAASGTCRRTVTRIKYCDQYQYFLRCRKLGEFSVNGVTDAE